MMLLWLLRAGESPNRKIFREFGSALIPALVETRQNQGVEAAQKRFSSMMFLNVLALAALAILLGLLASYLPCLASGFPAAKLRLTRELLYALLPFVSFSGFAGCASAALNASEKFALPAVAPLLNASGHDSVYCIGGQDLGLALSTSLVCICSFLFLTAWSVKLLRLQRLRVAGAIKEGIEVPAEAAR